MDDRVTDWDAIAAMERRLAELRRLVDDHLIEELEVVLAATPDLDATDR